MHLNYQVFFSIFISIYIYVYVYMRVNFEKLFLEKQFYEQRRMRPRMVQMAGFGIVEMERGIYVFSLLIFLRVLGSCEGLQ